MNVIGAIGVIFVAALAEMIFPQKLKPVSTLQPSLSSLEESKLSLALFSS
jgi:hypothetical protein